MADDSNALRQRPALRLMRLERATNAFVVFICLVVLYEAASVSFGAKVERFPTTVTDSSTSYKLAEQIPAIPGVAFGASQRSLLIFVRSTCSYCTASMPFYKALVGAAKRNNGDVQFIAISSEAPGTTGTYLMKHGVDLSRVVVTRASGYKVSGTPTLILVNAQGQVLKVWRGQIPPSSEGQVMSAVLGES